MQLKEYLFRSGIKLTEFAKKLGVSRPHLSLIVSGKHKPSPKLAKKIIEETHGQVSLEEIMFPEDYPLSLQQNSKKVT